MLLVHVPLNDQEHKLFISRLRFPFVYRHGMAFNNSCAKMAAELKMFDANYW